jgi:Leucine-rich repeat (LRR) protein
MLQCTYVTADRSLPDVCRGHGRVRCRWPRAVTAQGPSSRPGVKPADAVAGVATGRQAHGSAAGGDEMQLNCIAALQHCRAADSVKFNRHSSVGSLSTIAMHLALPVAHLLVLLLLFCGRIATAQPDFPPDAAALTDLFRSTGLSFAANSSMCSWLGVSCEAFNVTAMGSSTFMRVVQIDLNATAGMRGTLPDSIGQLDELVGLRVQSNELVGTLPSSLGNLQKLQLLMLINNRFNGTIPDSLGRLVRLRFLDLGSNTLSGTVPPSLGNLAQLFQLYLGSNRLVGSIPDTFFANMSQLNSLFLFSNQLSGSVPESLFNCSELARLYLYSNSFTGTLSAGIGQLAKLIELSLASNNFSGTLPGALFRLAQLRSMYLSSNAFVGTLPNSIGNLSYLFSLYLGQNRLQGTVPDSIALLSKLEFLDLSSNYIGGSIPSSLGGLKRLKHMSLASNVICGTIPSSLRALSDLTELELSCNMLTGDFDLLDATSFFPSLVNVSYNRLGPSLRIEHKGILAETAVLDARVVVDSGISFVCPYPDTLPPKAVLLRSPCQPPYEMLIKRAIMFVALVISLFVVICLVQRQCKTARLGSGLKLSVGIWLAISIKNVATLFLDFVVFISTIQDLGFSTDSCHVFNSLSVFRNIISISVLQYFQDLPPSTSFQDWLSQYMSFVSVKGDDPAVIENLAAFRVLCRSLHECDVDVSGTTCWQAHPELAATGRVAFADFYVLVIVVFAVRIALEAARILCVVLSCWQGATLEGRTGAELARSSFAAPVCFFFFPAANNDSISEADPAHAVLLESTADVAHHERKELGHDRANFLKQFVHYTPTPFDYMFRLVHSGILSSIPLLGVTLYFLLRVSQTGMSVSNWLSLVNLLWTIPRQIGQAIHAKWRTGCIEAIPSSVTELSTTAVAVDANAGDACFEAIYSVIR